MHNFSVKYQNVTLNLLAYEFPFSNKAETEEKIKEKLKSKNLDIFNQEFIELLRYFKDDVQVEISKIDKSKYYVGHHGRFANFKDFDIKKLTNDMIESHPKISPSAVKSFIPFAIFVYYLK